jgi:hypothetical protein
MAGMDNEQILGSCNAAGMHFFKLGTELCGRDERNLTGIDTSTIFEAQRHGGDGL